MYNWIFWCDVIIYILKWLFLCHFQEENYITCVLEDGNGGNIEVTTADTDDNSTVKSVDDGSCNGDTIKVKEENMDRRDDEDEEEYIEVEELSTVKSESLPIICPETDVRTKQDSLNGEIVQNKIGINNNNNKQTGPKYCQTCKISFNYLSTFLAHKKFYCLNNSTETVVYGRNDFVKRVLQVPNLYEA